MLDSTTRNATVAQAALGYLDRLKLPLGVVYATGDRKRPVGGAENWTRDPKRISELIRQHPDCGLFFNLGVARLVDLDLDVRTRADFRPGLAELEQDLGQLPPTWTITTPTGGEHRIFSATDSLDGLKQKTDLAPHVEMKVGGTCPLPPSTHHTGRAYQWKAGHAPWEIERAVLPTEWVERARTARRARREETDDGRFAEGERATALVREAGRLLNLFGPGDKFAAALHGLNDGCCEPPLPDAEVASIIKSAVKGWKRRKPPEEMFGPPGWKDKQEISGGVAVSFEEIERERVDYLLPGVPLGMLTILAGHPGLGKSMLKARWAALVSRGGPGHGAGGVLLLDAEDSPGVTRLRLEAAGADLRQVHAMRLSKGGEEVGITIPDDCSEIERLVIEHGVKLVVIDPVNGFFPSGIDYFKDTDTRRVLGPLARMANSARIAVVIVAHLNKSTGGTTLHRIGGSVGYGAAVRSALFLDRDPDDEDGEQGNRRVLVHAKSNVGPLIPSKILEIIPTEIDGFATAAIKVVGDSSIGAGELLARNVERPSKGTRTEACAQAMTAILADGERSSREVKSILESAGFSTRTIQRAARENVGVIFDKDGFQGEGSWRLPTDKDTFTRTAPATAPTANGAVEDSQLGAIEENRAVEPKTARSNVQPRQPPVNGVIGRIRPRPGGPTSTLNGNHNTKEL